MGRANDLCGTRAPERVGDGPSYTTEPEMALAALLHLLTRFPAKQTPAIAAAIVAHLRIIEDDPRIAACVRDCAGRLTDDWRAYTMLCDELADTPARSFS
jgi:hypothetical protein